MKISDFKKRILEKKGDTRSALRSDIAYLIGSQIEVARILKGFTQSDLARLVDTKQSSISRVESGSSLPSLSFLQKLADAFGTKLIPPKFQVVEDSKTQTQNSFASRCSTNVYVEKYIEPVASPYASAFVFANNIETVSRRNSSLNSEA